MHWLQTRWDRLTFWHVFLLPPAAVFWGLSAARRALYRRGVLPVARLPVPVVVVGNISVGGTGKTPLVLWLAAFLRHRGRRPGIISRGYGGQATGPLAVMPDSDPGEVGDEPLLLARKSGCPVWVGRDRAAAGRALLAANPGCDVVISDDGLQHYRLARDVEIAVVDGERGCGNGLLLPAGPLREGVSRLGRMDAVVVNGPGRGLPATVKTGRRFSMQLKGGVFYNLRDPALSAQAADFAGKRVHAVAGIGNPGRFFGMLRAMGLVCTEHPLPDHYVFRAGELDFPGADAVLMTEKDAVKCAGFAAANFWVLPVEAELDARLGEWVLERIRDAYGPQTA